ncbi:MAG: PTS sugar transporter subunit IIA [Streptococcaceae bacterium]|jgi:lichenan operon transcriptional antiterminator|nr:PTS sugar transporter subunit IIA [Streptococcaceae bacterium]
MMFEQIRTFSAASLEDKFYLSESTLYSCMKEVKKIILDYNLQLVYKTNYGYKIEGDELDKRVCLAKIEPDTKYADQYSSRPDDLFEIYKTVADSFLEAHYQVTESMLQNITGHVHQNLMRITRHHFVSSSISGNEDLSQTRAYSIAETILKKLLNNQLPSSKHFQNEVNLLALIILGKLEYSDNNEIQEEINDFIDWAFSKIDKKFAANFGTLAVLKMKIAFHLVPLFYRIKSRTQLKNSMTEEITQSFPQAANIALYFTDLIIEKYGLKISIDEITYIILHFNYGLSLLSQKKLKKRMLIITELRQSETSLLKFKIAQWFPNIITRIDFIPPSAANSVELEDYDAIFSTEGNLDKYHGGVSRLNFFPKESDFERINLALNGFSNITSILSKFSENCFYFGEASSRDEVLKIVTAMAAKQDGKELSSFLNSIEEREKIASSYFGNEIAMPHPLIPFTDKTIASVAILKKPIQWDGFHKVRLVILVSVAKNNPVEFQFWHYMSAFVQNEKNLEGLWNNPTFENLISCLGQALAEEF